MIQHQLPQYVCRKIVGAARILELMLDNDERSRMGSVFLELPGRIHEHRINQEWFEKCQPEIGGYFVLGEDGIPGYCAKKPFESIYELMSKLDTELLAGQVWNGPTPAMLPMSGIMTAAMRAETFPGKIWTREQLQAEVVRSTPPHRQEGENPHRITCPARYTAGGTCTCRAATV